MVSRGLPQVAPEWILARGHRRFGAGKGDDDLMQDCPLCGGNGWLPRQRNLPSQFYERCDCNTAAEPDSYGHEFIRQLLDAATGSEQWNFSQLGEIALETIERLAAEGQNRELAERVFLRFFDVMDDQRRRRALSD